jgi:hypothetical protein
LNSDNDDIAVEGETDEEEADKKETDGEETDGEETDGEESDGEEGHEEGSMSSLMLINYKIIESRVSIKTPSEIYRDIRDTPEGKL